MAKSFKSMLEVMVPASAKKGSGIENQWLEPASYDEKMVKAMKGDNGPDVYDHKDHLADNFKAQDSIKKNTKAPLVKEEDIALLEQDEIYDLAEEKSLDLIEEILDILDNLNEDVSNPIWLDVAPKLEAVRDLLSRTVSESQLDESFKVGKNQLGDGSSVKLTKEDIKLLKTAIANTNNKDKLLSSITKSKADFNDFMAFARSLNEDVGAIEDLLFEQDDDERRRGNLHAIKTSTTAGARIGAAVGGAIGGAYGAAAGTAYVAGKYATKGVLAFKRRREEKKREQARQQASHNPHAPHKSTIDHNPHERPRRPGPANDNLREERILSELSKQTLTRYIKRASSEHDMANFAKRQTENVPGKEKEAKYWARKEKNRKKGISRAIDKLEKE